MADLKISQLSSASALAGTEVLPVVQSSTTKKATVAQVLTPAPGSGIDYSRNTPVAGASKQILDWYEEGTYTPTVTASSGTFTTVSATANYTRIGRQVTVTFKIDITNAGTAAGNTLMSLPYATKNTNYSAGTGREDAATGISLQVVAFPSDSKIVINNYTGASVIVTGYSLIGSVSYFM